MDRLIWAWWSFNPFVSTRILGILGPRGLSESLFRNEITSSTP